jgi:Zn-finger nucleic acid-binding protein
MSSDLLCPVCGGALARIEAPDLCVCQCTRCGGAWLDNAASRVLVGLRTDGRVSAKGRDALMSAPEPTGGSGAEGPFRASGDQVKKCPECGTPLQASRPMGVPAELDVCTAHGTWFDASELRLCAQALEIAAVESQDAFVEELGDIERSRTWGDDPILAAGRRGWLSRLLLGER